MTFQNYNSGRWLNHYYRQGLECGYFSILFFFVSWVANTQLNHWTKRVVSTRVITQHPRNCPGPLPTGRAVSDCIQLRATGVGPEFPQIVSSPFSSFFFNLFLYQTSPIFQIDLHVRLHV